MLLSTPAGRRAAAGWPRVLLGLLVWIAGSHLAAADIPRPAAGDAPRWQFVENRRQWPAAVRYAVDLPAGRLYLENRRLVHALYDGATAAELQHHPGQAAGAQLKAHAYAVSFEGANEQAAPHGRETLPTKRNYFLGNDPAGWATDVPAFEEVRYPDLYPGTTLRLYSRADALEYDFELAAGADPGRIRLRYDGAESLRLTADGSLRIGTSVGAVVEQRPVAYQLVDGQRRAVPCAFRLDGRRVSFRLPRGYDAGRPLIIDPVLVYASYSGAARDNYGYAATYDAQGHLYSGALAIGVGFPATLGAYSLSYAGVNDLAILKFDPTATSGPASLLYATYLGGSGDDRPISLTTDAQGSLVVLAVTDHGSFPTTPGAYDTSFNGAFDLAVCKLSAAGNALLASTLVGGSQYDGLNQGALLWKRADKYRGDVQVDAQGHIYVASITESADFPTLHGFQRTLNGASDAVTLCLSPMLDRLVWSSFLGGSGHEMAYALQVDSTRGIYVAGGSSSPSLPGTAGALHPTSHGGSDGFVAHLSPDGSILRRVTFLGTTLTEQVYGLQLDAQGEVYVLGQTEGIYPVTPGAYAVSGGRLFVHKLDHDLTTTRFSTTVGCTEDIMPTAFGLDHCGRILIAGFGDNILTAPVTPDALQPQASSKTFYVMQLAPDARRLLYATFFANNGPHVDGGNSRFDRHGALYQAMCTTGGVPTTPNAFARTGNAGYSNAAFKLDLEPLSAAFVQSDAPLGPRITRGCAPLLVYFRPLSEAATAYRWTFGDGTTSTQAVPPPHWYRTPGRYPITLTVSDTTGCLPSRTAVDTLEVLPSPTAGAGPDRRICLGSTTQLSAANPGIAGCTFAWSPAEGLRFTSGASVTATPTVSTSYVLTVTTPGGCQQRDTVRVEILPLPQLRVSYPAQVFTGQPLTFANDSRNAVAYQWAFGDGQSSTVVSPTHTYPAPGRYPVLLQATSADGCPAEGRYEVDVRRFELPNVITPNGDGLNDTFKPFVSFAPIDLEVYNRWGRRVYAQTGYAGSWAAEGLPAGVYYYRLSVQGGDTWKGWVEVMR